MINHQSPIEGNCRKTIYKKLFESGGGEAGVYIHLSNGNGWMVDNF